MRSPLKFIASLCLAAMVASTQAQVYPDRPIKIIVPQAAASGADVLARMLADALGPRLGQSVVVENRPGANGILAANALKSDTSAGHVLMLAGYSVLTLNPSLYKNLSYEPFKDFSFIAPIAETRFVLLASLQSGLHRMDELIAKAKAQPGRVNYASAGAGNSSHLAAEMLMDRLGITMTHVPYKGSTPILTAMMAGEVDVTVGIPNSSAQLVKAGKLTAIAALGAERLPEFPDVPTLRELRLDVPDMPGWYALMGPSNMAPANVAKLNALVQDFLKDPEVRKRLVAASLAPIPGSAERIRNQGLEESKVWGELITRKQIELQ
jgi:tripartite-type tricarboxylate transporter receptor subunit TctC